MAEFRVKATKKRFHNSRLQEPGDVFVMSGLEKSELPKDVEVLEEVGEQKKAKSGKKTANKSSGKKEPETLKDVNKDSAEQVTAPKTADQNQEGDSLT